MLFTRIAAWAVSMDSLDLGEMFVARVEVPGGSTLEPELYRAILESENRTAGLAQRLRDSAPEAPAELKAVG